MDDGKLTVHDGAGGRAGAPAAGPAAGSARLGRRRRRAAIHARRNQRCRSRHSRPHCTSIITRSMTPGFQAGRALIGNVGGTRWPRPGKSAAAADPRRPRPRSNARGGDGAWQRQGLTGFYSIRLILKRGPSCRHGVGAPGARNRAMQPGGVVAPGLQPGDDLLDVLAVVLVGHQQRVGGATISRLSMPTAATSRSSLWMCELREPTSRVSPTVVLPSAVGLRTVGARQHM